MGSLFKSTTYALLLFLGAWLTVRFALPLFFPFLLGLGLALTAEPLVRLLVRLRLPRPLASVAGVSFSFLAIAALVTMLCAFLLRELGLLAGILPDLASTAQRGISSLEGWLLSLSGHAPAGIRPLLKQKVTGFFSGGSALLSQGLQYMLGLAGKLLRGIPDSALSFGTGIIASFMISAKLPRLSDRFRQLLPRQRLAPLLEGFRRIRTAVGGWLTAQLKLAGITWVLLLLGFVLLRIPHAPLWASGICLVDAFPVLGTGTVLLPWALICFLEGQTARAIGLLGLYAVISVTRSVMEPRMVGRELGLDPLLTLMALYAGYRLWGLAGMILAPMLAVVALQFFPRRRPETS